MKKISVTGSFWEIFFLFITIIYLLQALLTIQGLYASFLFSLKVQIYKTTKYLIRTHDYAENLFSWLFLNVLKIFMVSRYAKKTKRDMEKVTVQKVLYT